MDPNVRSQTLVETFDRANHNSILEYNVALITLLTYILCQHALLSVASAVYSPGRVLPYKRLMGICRWMGSHFHDWIDYNRVAFSIELLEWGRTFSDFWGKTVLHIYG